MDGNFSENFGFGPNPLAAERPLSARRRVVPLIRVLSARRLVQDLIGFPQPAALSALLRLINRRRLHNPNIALRCYGSGICKWNLQSGICSA